MKIIQDYYAQYKNTPLQGKIFYLLISFGLIISIVTSLANAALELGLPVILTTAFFGVFCLIMLVITIKTSNYITSAYITFWVLLLAIYPGLWLFNGGSSGPTLTVYIFNTFLTSILFDKIRTKKLLMTQFVTLILLFIVEYTNPSIIEPYSNDRVRFIDLSFAATIMIFFSYAIVSRLMEEYRLRIDELHVVQQKLQHLTITDDLTGIYNRRYIIQEISKQLKDDQVLPFTLIMFDIDDFKLINDRYGHSVGDDVIIGVSNFLNESVRPIDGVGRIGVDEFLILLMDTTEVKARKRAELIREQLSQLNWPIEGLKVTVSGGLYTKKPSDDLEALLEKVDLFLYQAKATGKNKII